MKEGQKEGEQVFKDLVPAIEARIKVLESMSEEEKAYWKEEEIKCIRNPYYFYTTYFMIEGEPAKTLLSEQEFNKYWNRRRL